MFANSDKVPNGALLRKICYRFDTAARRRLEKRHNFSSYQQLVDRYGVLKQIRMGCRLKGKLGSLTSWNEVNVFYIFILSIFFGRLHLSEYIVY